MVATLILPGLNGSAEGHWQRHWARDKTSAAIVRQASWSRPVLEHWLAALERELERVEEAWLVTHSLGCLLAANLADHPAARHVKGAFLVAPCDLDRTERLHPGAIDFGTMPTKALPFPSFVVGSRDDPYMDFVELRHHAARWDSELHDLGHAGHINIASGFGRWEQGFQLFSAFTKGVEDRQFRRARPPLHDVLCGAMP
ncbi:RBBP9/YdeN family alpha/beta hydrolase [Rhizobium sp. LEGMi198b]|uniref:RBBP9/YdeN family alpha/beta hydrolase n=1 Tax=Rhizobium sp. CB3171 TaxID=3039157 RepID=UPI0024B048C9|nr:alpha/beta hydrolase [Rhizobium sp. CB3171]WFU03777.1 alpha/beta fold hydrolase [Rhizobium sp. CB3171]